ncbi:MAG: hypothetical protein RL088_2267 [Verrucomicrobiota bacterium]|jgi:hypothetical protein
MINKPAILLLATTAAATTALAEEKRPAAQKMPEVTITDVNLFNDQRAIGETGRPEWTTARRFPTTRVYIQKEPWQVGAGTWWRYRHKRDGTSISRATAEIEIGLPHRMQLDLYYDMAIDGSRRSRTEDFAVELRYALADWGKLPLNPTLYAEYKWVDEGADVLELKLLLGDQLPGGWHYGANLVWEKELGGERTTEWQLVGGVSKTLVDGKFSLGIEGKYVHETTTTSRSEPEHKYHVGPSAQWRITDKFSVATTALFGLNDDSPRQECWLVLSYDFGRGADETKYKPVSGRR